MKDFSPFTGMAQVILWSVLFVNVIALTVGQIVMAGHWEWWMLIMIVLVLLMAAGLHIVWKEYKEDKQ
ncbi:MAG: hypothetical protein IJ640_00055 [Prevotella sp.]|nr:hypothetical protein [Prevotella sp.]